MNKVYGVIFKDNGKVYDFINNKLTIKKLDLVIVETEKGTQLGKIVSYRETEDENLKSIIRLASEDDKNQHFDNLKDADKALKKAKSIANELKLNMNFIDACFSFERDQLIFNFLSDERVDFRELAKKLASLYRTRIELRQIGARDKAREVSGLGTCGRRLCCSSFLKHIDPVSINMAKNQGIALNPNKINGSCGRLLCCLGYEDENYLECKNGMPFVGEIVKTKAGNGKVTAVDVLNRTYKIDTGTEKVTIEIDENIK